MLNLGRAVTLVAFATTWTLSACGGGGGGDTGSQPPPCDAAAVPPTCYVSTNGSDANSGADPAHALRTITRAAQIARDNYMIVVAPGVYAESVTADRQGATANGLIFLANVSGGGTVSVDPPNGAGFKLNNSVNSVIDGFTVAGGTDAGIILNGSHNATVQNCVVSASSGDGIRLQDARNVLVFNNLVYNNGGNGVFVTGQGSGSPDAHLFNNTIYGNGSGTATSNRGVTIGNTSAPSPRAALRNNILRNNLGDASIRVVVTSASDSEQGYDEDSNLILPADFIPTNLPGANRYTFAPLFEDTNNLPDGFHLQRASQAINMGTVLNDSRITDPVLSKFRTRTVTLTGTGDTGNLDLGYHFVRIR